MTRCGLAAFSFPNDRPRMYCLETSSYGCKWTQIFQRFQSSDESSLLSLCFKGKSSAEQALPVNRLDKYHAMFLQSSDPSPSSTEHETQLIRLITFLMHVP